MGRDTAEHLTARAFRSICGKLEAQVGQSLISRQGKMFLALPPAGEAVLAVGRQGAPG